MQPSQQTTNTISSDALQSLQQLSTDLQRQVSLYGHEIDTAKGIGPTLDDLIRVKSSDVDRLVADVREGVAALEKNI